ncbi:hypothetical protein AYO20_09398 [Fonsecaea nubica]|uniref:Zn(2)-C6 fungal-type domain-containing protein n=1 Tax=Fonsecaea nubica TaxID=856822 RepID=A0A178CH60_9EURO|nr:hypothetical protein AYO20_09398 [Fonsecaea nubica]OAL28674.1 hypothetical protein AYO20_09398 [Fonsecaea nubica]
MAYRMEWADSYRFAPAGPMPLSNYPNSIIGFSDAMFAAPEAEAHAYFRAAKRKASTACEACKVAKRKCEGGPPCSSCLKAGTACDHNFMRDGRRQWKLFEKGRKARLFDVLVEWMRRAEPSTALVLFQKVKEAQSEDEILEFLETVCSAVSSGGPAGSDDDRAKDAMRIQNLLC